jgi:PAS domain S-box-containing protein
VWLRVSLDPEMCGHRPATRYPHSHQAGRLIVPRTKTAPKSDSSFDEAFFRTLADEAPQGVVVLQGDHIIYANAALANLVGYSLKEVRGWKASEFLGHVVEADRATIAAKMAKAIAGEVKTRIYEMRILNKKGETRWLQSSAQLIQAHGQPAVLAVIMDVTEKKRTEQAYRDLVESSVQGVIILQGGRVVFANEAIRKMGGYTVKELMSLTPEQLQQTLHRDYQARIWGRMEKRLAGEPEPSSYEIQTVAKDGTQHRLEVFASLIEYEGKPAVEATFVDISERHKAEQALQESEARYRVLFDNVPVGLYRSTRDGQILDANPALVDILGAPSREALKNTNAIDFYATPEERLQMQKLAEEQDTVRGFEVQFRRLDGQLIWVRDSFQAIRNEEGQVQSFEGTIEDITQRKKAELALREREKRYRALLEHSNDAVFIISLDLKHLEVNQRAADLLGYTVDEMIGMPVSQVVNKQEYSDSIRVQKGLLAGEDIPVYERIFRRKDGVEFPMEMTVSLVTDVDGNPLHFQSIGRDITARKLAEDELRESEERFRSVVETSHSGVLVVDDHFRFIYVNDELCRMLGYNRKEVLGHDFREFLDEEGKILVGDRYVRRQRGEEVPSKYEFNIVRRDKQKRRVEISVTTITTSAGEIRTVAQILDITERKRAEDALRESETKYRTLIETSPDAITVTDLQGKVVFANQQAVRLYGAKSESDLVGRSAFEMIAPAYVPQAITNMQKTLETGRSDNLEYELLKTDGSSYPAELVASLLSDASGKPEGFIGVIRDVSERKEAQARYRSLFDSVPVGMFRTTPDGTILDANPGLVRMLGYKDRESLLKRKASSFYVDPAERKKWETRVAKEDIVMGVEAQFRRLDGQVIWVELTARAMRDAKGMLTHYEGTLEDITERKNAEAELRESEVRYRALVEQSLQAIVIFQGDPVRIVFANEAFADLSGYSVEEALTLSAKKVRELVHPADQEFVWTRTVDRLAGKSVPQRYEFRLVRKDKRIRWVEHFSRLIDYKGAPAVQSAGIDVTERKQAETALTESEEKFRALVEQMSDWVWTLDTKGRITYSNDAVEDILGYSAGQVVGMTPCQFLRSEDEERAQQLFADLVKGKRQIRTLVIRFQHRDGSTVVLEARGRPMLDKNGDLLGFRGICRDITDRLKMIEQLRALGENLD